MLTNQRGYTPRESEAIMPMFDRAVLERFVLRVNGAGCAEWYNGEYGSHTKLKGNGVSVSVSPHAVVLRFPCRDELSAVALLDNAVREWATAEVWAELIAQSMLGAEKVLGGGIKLTVTPESVTAEWLARA